jgi:4-hydroxybenzoate polyprenyltransferase
MIPSAEPSLNTNPWLHYIRERFPQVIYGSLAAGIAFSGAWVNKESVYFLAPLLVFVGTWMFLFNLRLLGDLKDIKKDQLAFPHKPLVRGLIRPIEALKVANVLMIVEFAYSLVLWVVLNEMAAFFYLILVCITWLSYKDFYAGKMILRFPIIETLVQPSYMIGLALFTVSANQPEHAFGMKAWSYAAVLYGAMLVYTLCRRLNPHLHPIVASFIHFYGFRRTYLLAVGALLLSAVGAMGLHTEVLLWPIEFCVLLTLSLLFFQREGYRIPEMTAGVSLILHAWSGIF